MATPPRQLSSPSGALKRKRNENNWKTNIAKTARNLGLAYTSKDSGKEKDARRIGDPCNCKNKCFDRVLLFPYLLPFNLKFMAYI